MKALTFCITLLCLTTFAHAKQFEVFDGQFYNGLYYPMVDIIEWGEQNKELPHIEFHLHSKDKPIDVSVVSGDKNGKPVLWIMYDLKFRGERICRRVLAPAQFKEGQKLYAYRDNSDSDYDNVYVYSEPWKQTAKNKVPEYTMATYERCSDEQADNMPEPKDKKAAAPAAASPVASTPSGVVAPKASASTSPLPAKEGKGVPVDYDNTAVPFSF
ncbi:MAG TPA: hypothetical protein VIH99_12305 [Bdellovibrionota bacterium]|jgi:hypothetical protein